MKTHFVFIVLLISFRVAAQQPGTPSFHVVPLGIKGGIDESNLSAYLVAPSGTKDYICLDAGTIYAGLEKAIVNTIFSGSVSQVQKDYIKGYFISHAHLDHVSGLIITSPDDSAKTVYALPSCMKMLQDYYFNGEAWANFGDEGKGFLLKKYHFKTLSPGEITPIDNSSMQVTAFPLSHVKPFESTAFLVHHKGDYVLYLGDTGADEVEKSNKLNLLWQAIAPLVKAGTLKGIFIEVSFPNDQADAKLFGHLTPRWLLKEMNALAELTGKRALKKCPLVITHVKPPAERVVQLEKELRAGNILGLQFIFPTQAKAFEL